MGKEHREDHDRARRHDDADVERAPGHDADEQVDTSHADVQKRLHGEPTQGRGKFAQFGPERAFDGKGDQDALWTRFEGLLAAGVVSPDVIPAVRDMDGERRAMVDARLDELPPIVSGADLLVVAELVSAAPRAAVLAALRSKPPPSAAQMRAFLDRIGAWDAGDLGDAAVVAALRAAYPGSPVAVVPTIHAHLDVPALASWYLTSTPHEQLAMAFVRSADPEATAAKLNKLDRGAWMWAFHVTEAMVSINQLAVEAYAKASSQADVREVLQRRYDAYQNAGSGAKEEKDLARELSQRRPDADVVVEDLAQVHVYGADDLQRARPRFLATADARQIDQATQLAGFDPSVRLDWLLDGTKVTVEALRDVLAAWPDEDLAVASNARIVAKIRKRFADASPAEIFGRVPSSLYAQAIANVGARTWIAERGEPNDILQMLTFSPGATAALSTWIAGTARGWSWLDRVGAGTDDTRLRILALHAPEPIAKKIRDELLGDYRDPTAAVAPRPMPASATGDPNDRLERGLAYQRDGDLAIAASELRPEDVADLKKDPAQLDKLLARTKGSSLLRVLFAVDPPLRDLLERKEVAAEGVLDRAKVATWLHARPAADVVEALSDATTAATAQQLWPEAPLELFPPLRQPAVLARVLDANTDVLGWILRHSEPLSALKVYGAAACARATVAALDEDHDLLDWLPSGKVLDPRTRTYLYSLYNVATGDIRGQIKKRIDADESEDEDATVDERAAGDGRKERDAMASNEAIEDVLTTEDATAADLMTLLRERGGDAADLVASEPALVLRALESAGHSPLVALPGVPVQRFLRHEKLAEWTFDTTPGFLILREATTDAALAITLAAGLTARRPFKSWLNQLPSGSALSPDEEAGLKAIFRATSGDAPSRDLFRVRFGSRLGDDYDRKEVTKLWTVMERVPQAHVEQDAIVHFYEYDHEMKGVDGEYGGRGIGFKDTLLGEESDNPVYDRTGATAEMSKDELKAAFGLDDAQVAQWIRDKRVTEKNGVYTMNPTPQPDRFTGTALHEIGHAVDDMLGENTDLIYGLAGWRAFGDGDFEAWATELGGWDKVRPEDKPKIQEAWAIWTNSSRAAGRPPTELKTLVAEDHPAIADRYVGVGVVDLARGTDGASSNPFVRNGRAFIFNGLYQRRYSLPMKAVHAAPSAYALTAPGEYFAECYMAYYLPYEGTPDTASKKGSLLAPWIKTWFDENVDRIGYNPSRPSYG